ncbi:class I SAM-dependent methyltransferase [Riemerella anatipestifer]|uniref:Caffeoyl-CoA o-methyltransferase n=1 Tax=Riemerella anatipestifer (strain ATCC 11845 / DSM 15868 / JCM 9532 / NCTC 11014) TaxID=693978 RepID=E4TCK2_RIEAD|nr:O-methyltransferase [Riemerella anatipestifer]ADQ82511.1 Caffeoyl-CoA O-methyltransferase [Riemerella anatipestifer ATCC 11845 = DSM 15868]ADZ11994.1 Predicted O-methyltransferase [Riemerella anatipestifer RA-GD]AFD56519.1 caffeoyl-CoA o-methyltransferase [Riemerella anatipestifer ATCC 11845 = DSM 15868]AGC39552.1 putative O-methyltransferase [Riemerella anatipestifer RA-CH-2]AKP71615.1 caffeoyl-CoA o-methyltransferase [Riemerella anatipestifer]
MGFFEEQCPDMDRYLELHTSSEPEILRKLRRETYQKTTQPHMISGVQQGRLLSIISQLLRPKSVLEIGTFTGYATLSMAEGLPDEGKITTLDINEDLAYIPKKYFEESIYSDKIDFRLENALDYLNSTQEMFDMVFVDADKGNYVNYFNAVKDRLNSGGVLMFDNVLWYGKVLEENSKDKSTQVIKELNEILAKDPDFENLILPLRDGLNLARKK